MLIAYMVRESTAREAVEVQRDENLRPRAFGGGEPPSPPIATEEPIIGNSRLALLMFLGAEALCFGGLSAAFLGCGLASTSWPPAFRSSLAVAVTCVRTWSLLPSGVALPTSLKAILAGQRARLFRYIGPTALF